LLVVCALRPLLHYPTSRRGYAGALLVLILGTAVLFASKPESFADITSELGIGRSAIPESALSGGVIGQILAAPPSFRDEGMPAGYIRRFIGTVGTVVIAAVFVLSGLIFIWIADWAIVFRSLVAKAPEAVDAVNGFAKRFQQEEDLEKVLPSIPPVSMPINENLESSREALLNLRRESLAIKKAEAEAETELKPFPDTPRESELNSAEPEIHSTVKGEVVSAPKKHADYILPPITMLSKGLEASGESKDGIDHCRRILQQTLESFNVDGQVTGIISGPRVTRYEISLAPGVILEK